MRAIFEKYDSANIHFNSAKTTFCAPKAVFLGWQISAEGLSLDPKRVDVIQRFKPPTNVKQVRAYLGAINYHRRLIPNLSRLADLLYRLTRHDQPFVWSEEQQNAFMATKHLLVT